MNWKLLLSSAFELWLITIIEMERIISFIFEKQSFYHDNFKIHQKNYIVQFLLCETCIIRILTIQQILYHLIMLHIFLCFIYNYITIWLRERFYFNFERERLCLQTLRKRVNSDFCLVCRDNVSKRSSRREGIPNLSKRDFDCEKPTAYPERDNF